MKSNFLRLSLSLGLFFGLFLPSCDDCGPFPNKFKTLSLNYNLREAVYSDTAAIPLLLTPIEHDEVLFSMYGISIQPVIETYFAEYRNRWDFSLISSAYACDPAPPETDERIDSIVIQTIKDFDVDHPAGTDLSDIFDAVVFDAYFGYGYEKYSLTDFLTTHPAIPNQLVLILISPPSMTTDFQFIVKYYQHGIDHDYFEITTNSVVIKKE